MNLLIPRLPDILELSDKIRQRVPGAAKKFSGFEMGA